MVAWVFREDDSFLAADMGPWLGGDVNNLVVPTMMPDDPNLFELDWWVGDPDPSRPGFPSNAQKSYRYRTGPTTTDSGFYGSYFETNPPPHFYAAVTQSGGGNWTPAFSPESVTPSDYASTGTADPISGQPPADPPNNDNFANRVTLSMDGQTLAWTTAGATLEAGEEDRYDDPGSTGSIWFEISAQPQDSRVTVNSDGEYGSFSIFYEGDLPPSISEAMNGHYSTDYNDSHSVTVDLKAGKATWIAIQTYIVSTGTIQVSQLYPGPWLYPEAQTATVYPNFRLLRYIIDDFDTGLFEQESYNQDYQNRTEKQAGYYDNGPGFRANRSSTKSWSPRIFGFPGAPAGINVNGSYYENTSRGYSVQGSMYSVYVPPDQPGSVGGPYTDFDGWDKPGSVISTSFNAEVQTHNRGDTAEQFEIRRLPRNGYIYDQETFKYLPPNGIEDYEEVGPNPPAPVPSLDDYFGTLLSTHIAGGGLKSTEYGAATLPVSETVQPVNCDVGLYDLDTGMIFISISPSNRSIPPERNAGGAPEGGADKSYEATADLVGTTRAHATLEVTYRPPRVRYYYSEPVITTPPPMRQRHRDDGLTTDARQQKGYGSSLQTSIRRGGRVYY